MYKNDLTTMSGMWAVWDYETYKNVYDYDEWEKLFCEDEDIKKQIEKKTFVPIYIFEDGCCGFNVKIDEELNEREKKYICVKSEQYLLKSSGKIVVSGIENIGKDVKPTESIIINLAEGNYTVQIYMLSWDEEPGSYLSNGEVSPNALPDFVVLIKSNAKMNCTYRERINTFSEDDNN